MDPADESNPPVNRRPGEALADAIRAAFALLELHRHSAFLLTQSKRAGERYEGLYLIDAIDGLERYLHVAEELTDSQAMRFWVQDVLAEHPVGPGHGRRQGGMFAAGARSRARARARARFVSIVSEVTEELEASISDPPDADEQSWRCVAPTKQGTRCKNPAGPDGFCELHARLANGRPPAATSPDAAGALR